MEMPDCAKTKKTVLWRHKISRDRFLFCSNMPFESKNKNMKWFYKTILSNCKKVYVNMKSASLSGEKCETKIIGIVSKGKKWFRGVHLSIF